MKNLLITAGTGDLGSELNLGVLKKEYMSTTFSRDKEKVDRLRKRVELELGPEVLSRFFTTTGNINFIADVIHVLSYSLKMMKKDIDVINTAGVFRFDEELSEVPEKDCLLPLVKFAAKYSKEADYDKKLAFYNMMWTNYLGPKQFVEYLIKEAEEKDVEKPLVCDIGTVGAVAEMIGKPFEDTSLYGKTKAMSIKHLESLVDEGKISGLRIIHPGPFGKSALEIAEHFGSTYAESVSSVVEHIINMLEEETDEKITQGIIASENHPSWEKFGDIEKLGLPGLTWARSKKTTGADSVFIEKKKVAEPA